jgi:anti-anti-sigma factor
VAGARLRRIVVDVSQLAFVGVAGLRALTALGARAQQQLIAVQLTGVSRHMRRVLRIAGQAGLWDGRDTDGLTAENTAPGSRRGAPG